MTSLSTITQKKRFVSLVLPHFAIENQNLWRSRSKQRPPESGRYSKQNIAPFALIDRTKRGQRLSAVDEYAEQQGLAPGMALSDALALCPLLQTRKAAPKTDVHRLLQLANWCERYSPLCNIYDDNSLWIDVTGTTHLFGGEKGLLEKISKDFSKLGYTIETGIASSFGAAFALSHLAFDKELETRIISPQKMQHALAPLPVKALRLAPETISLLHRLGLSTIGQLVDLPRNTLKRRFPSIKQAKSVLLRLDQILGLRDEPLAPLTPPVVFSCRLRFAEALYSKQMLERALIRLIAEIIRQLEAQKQGARRLTFTLWRSDGSTAHIKIGTSTPCRDKKHIFKLFQEKLNHMEPGFGVDILALFVSKSEALSATQTSLENRHQTRNSSPSALIDRLYNRLGAQKIGYLRALQSHIPERAQQLTKTPPANNFWPSMVLEKKDGLQTFPPDRPFLLLAPPEPIEVMAPLPDEPPLLFTWRRVRRKVIASTGPERITPEWWRELDEKTSSPRDYYKVTTNEGTAFWLYRDGLYEGEQRSASPPQWFMHGFFG
jgi:protein ImuB